MDPTTTDAVLAFLAAAAIAWLLVPYAERLAYRIGAIDPPKERGLHDRPMPRLSGLAIFAGDRDRRLDLAAARRRDPLDPDRRRRDRRGRGRRRRARPAGAAEAARPGRRRRLIPVLGGVRVDVLTLPFVGGFELGWVAYPLTVIGIVAVVNVINFIDGVDGLAAGVCTIAAIALAVIALSLDRNAAGVLAALTAGGALGFLRHGFPPASSFMGDTGSNLLGYLLAIASVQGALKTNAVVALVFPLVRARRADPRHRLRRRQAAQVPPADLPGRPLALPPPDGQHRLLPAPHARLPLRLDAGAGRPRPGPALRPLQRRPRQLRRALDRGDGGLRVVAVASSVYLIYVLEILKLSRGRLNPETGEFEAIETRMRTLVTGCDKPHESGFRKPIDAPFRI